MTTPNFVSIEPVFTAVEPIQPTLKDRAVTNLKKISKAAQDYAMGFGEMPSTGGELPDNFGYPMQVGKSALSSVGIAALQWPELVNQYMPHPQAMKDSNQLLLDKAKAYLESAKINAAAESKALNLPAPGDELTHIAPPAQDFIKKPKNLNETVGQAVIGAGQGLGNVAQSLVTPENLAMLGMGALVPPLGAAMGIAFAPSLIKSSAQGLKSAVNKADEGNYAGAGRDLAGALGTGYFAKEILTHPFSAKGMKPEIALPEFTEVKPIEPVLPKEVGTGPEVSPPASIAPEPQLSSPEPITSQQPQQPVAKITEPVLSNPHETVPETVVPIEPAVVSSKENVVTPTAFSKSTANPSAIDFFKNHYKDKPEEFEKAVAPDLIVNSKGLPDLKSGDPITVEAYRGTGRASKESIYSDGVTGPTLGDATYSAINEPDAKMYGPDITKRLVTLKNPYVIDGDASLKKLFGQDIPYDHESRVPLLEKARSTLEKSGYDGVIVNLPKFADTNFRGESLKRTKEIFEHTQLIEFKKAEPTISKSNGVLSGPSASAIKFMSMEDIRSDKPVGAADIVQHMKNDFGVPIRFGKFSQRALGIYKLKPEVVRLKDAGDFPTAAHEVAHFLDKTGVINYKEGLPDFKNELKKLDYDQKKQRVDEGFAEFVRYWLTNDPRANEAPKFKTWFEDHLKTIPEISDKMARSKELFSKWAQQGAEKRVLGQIDFDMKTERPPLNEFISKSTRKFKTAWTDALSPIKWAVDEITGGDKLSPSKDPFQIATAANKTASTKAYSFVMDGAFDYAGNKIGPGLKEIISSVPKEELPNFLSYAYALRAKESYIKRGKNAGIGEADVNFVIDKHKGNQTWNKAAADITNWNNNLLKYLEDAGGLSPEARELINAANPIYVPLKRVFVDAAKGEGGTGAGFSDVGNPIKRVKGSGRKVQDPLISMMQQAEKIISTADRVRVGRALAELSEKYQGAGRMIEKVNSPKEVRTTTLGQMESQLKEIGVDLSDADMDSVLSVFTNAPKYFGRDNVVSFYKDGKRGFYEVDKDLFEALKSMDNVQMGWFLDMTAGRAKRTATLGATGIRAGFQLITNPIRDAWSAIIQSERPGLGHTVRAVRALKDIFTNSEDYQRYKRLGGEMNSIIGGDMKKYKTLRDELLANDAKSKALNIAKHPVEVLKKVLGWSESLNRMAEFKMVQEKMGKVGSADTSIAALNASADVTINFRRAGKYAQILNQYIAFFNPGIQGVEKAIRTIHDRPIKSGLSAVASITVPALSLWYLNKDEKWYQEIPQWEKQLFLHFKIGDEIVRLPMPFEFGQVFGSIPVAIAESIYRKDPSAIEKSMSQFAQNTVPDFTPTILKTGMESYFNYNTFTDRPIVPEGRQDMVPELQYNKSTAPVYIKLGKILNVAPAQIEHLVSGYTGGIGNDLANLSKLTTNGPADTSNDAADRPVVGRMFSRQNRLGASVDELFTKFDEQNKIWNSYNFLLKKGDTENANRILKDYELRFGDHALWEAGVDMVKQFIQINDYQKATDISRVILGKDKQIQLGR